MPADAKRSISGRRSVAPPSAREVVQVTMPEAAQPRLFKLKRSPPDGRDLRFSRKMSATALPASVDMTPLLPPALDQGDIGSCAAHAGGLALRYLYKKQVGQDWMPSRLALYFVTRVFTTGDAPEEDSGCYLRDICKAVAKYQLPPEIYWRYDVSKYAQPPPFLQQGEIAPAPLVEYRSVPLDEYSLKTALAEKNPIIIGIALYDSFMTSTVAMTGTVPMPQSTEQCLGGHAVLLVGWTAATTYTPSRWVVRNSCTLIGVHA